jgi:uncharacterized membrane protein YeaQ/YmgE (transglycosylase-associated protein family)
MSFIITWILLGLVAGYFGSKVINCQGQEVNIDIYLGVAGALSGGYLFQSFARSGITEFSFWSIFVAVISAIVLLIAYHAIRRVGWSRS